MAPVGMPDSGGGLVGDRRFADTGRRRLRRPSGGTGDRCRPAEQQHQRGRPDRGPDPDRERARRRDRERRVDRIRPGVSAGARFSARDLADAQVEAMLSRGIPPSARRHQVRVVVHAPAALLGARFGPWIGTITAVDASTCLIETGADSVEQLAIYLGMLGADFTVSEPPELVDAVRMLATRCARSVEPA
jgi:WYL domain